MKVSLKHVLYGTVGLWTLVALQMIWSNSLLSDEMIMSLTVLNVAGVAIMWLKDR